MRVTAILNLKGGTGKSTTAINLAAVLAKHHGKRVLLVDADSQCNVTEFFGADPREGSVASALREFDRWDNREAGLVSLIQPTTFPGVDILAADDSLMDLDLSKAERGEACTQCLAYLAKAAAGSYDSMLIDCPAAFNAAAAAALIAADDVIIPIKLDAFSLRGMGNLMRQIANMRQINPRLRVAGFLPTMWYKSEIIRQSEETLRKTSYRVYPHIRRSNTVDAMTYEQQPLIVSSPSSGAGRDYRTFAATYLEEA